MDHNEPAGGSLEFVVPRDVTDGFINHRRENYRFRYSRPEQHPLTPLIQVAGAGTDGWSVW